MATAMVDRRNHNTADDDLLKEMLSDVSDEDDKGEEEGINADISNNPLDRNALPKSHQHWSQSDDINAIRAGPEPKPVRWRYKNTSSQTQRLRSGVRSGALVWKR
jgi:hypothetical protein